MLEACKCTTAARKYRHRAISMRRAARGNRIPGACNEILMNQSKLITGCQSWKVDAFETQPVESVACKSWRVRPTTFWRRSRRKCNTRLSPFPFPWRRARSSHSTRSRDLTPILWSQSFRPEEQRDRRTTTFLFLQVWSLHICLLLSPGPESKT